MFNKSALTSVEFLEEVKSMSKGKFPLMYLGCPTGHGKKKKVGFSKLLK